MIQQLAFGFSGMALLTARVWLIGSTRLRPKAVAPLASLLVVCGLLLIASAALQAGSSWSLRLVIIGTYAAAGVFLGETIINVLSKSRAGDVLASLRKCAPTGLSIISAVIAPIGLFGVVMFSNEHRPGSMLVLLGQALFFITFGIWAALMAGLRWNLAERGILGPNVFVPWQQILAYKWQGPNVVAITTAGFFSGARRFTISVASEDSKLAAAILARKVSVY